MEAFIKLVSQYNIELTIATYGILLIIIIVLITQMIRMSKITKVQKEVFHGKGDIDLEELLIYQNKQVEKVILNQKQVSQNIENIEEKMIRMYSKAAIYKYDAFSGSAGKLSFVYVLLNHKNSGMMLNAIFSSEGHYLYIKDITNGSTDKELSKEERIALEKAINQYE